MKKNYVLEISEILENDHAEDHTCGPVERKGKSNQGKVFVSSEMLSEYMAVTQRSVNRILKQLKDSHIIEITKSHIIIKDFEKLLKEETDSMHLQKRMPTKGNIKS